MADPEPRPEVLSALVRLMSNLDDPSEMSDSEIVEAIQQARQSRKMVEGAGATELRRRGWTWEKMGEALGVDLSTPHRWVSDHKRRSE